MSGTEWALMHNQKKAQEKINESQENFELAAGAALMVNAKLNKAYQDLKEAYDEIDQLRSQLEAAQRDAAFHKMDAQNWRGRYKRMRANAEAIQASRKVLGDDIRACPHQDEHKALTPDPALGVDSDGEVFTPQSKAYVDAYRKHMEPDA